MKPDPVVAALRAALQVSDSVELRNALGEHFLRLGAAPEALAEHEAALLQRPTDPAALRGAAQAAEVCGQEGKAQAYRLVLQQLAASGAVEPSISPSAAGVAGPAPPAAVSAPAGVHRMDTADPSLSRPPVDAEPSEGDSPTALRPARSKAEAEPPGIRLIADGGAVLAEEPPPLSLADVGGMEDVKERLNRSFLVPLRNPALMARYGKRMSGGLLLYGAPGCGKTFLARALAGEIGASFVNVALTDVLNLWHGESERNLHEIFENARRQAPALLFFDELDALGQRRSHLKGSAGRTLANQMLSEMDGFAARNEGVYLLGATNHPWDLDPALRRPGRFDRMLFVPPPDAGARRAILELKLRGRPVSREVDLTRTVKATDGFSGADLEAIIETSIELALEESLAAGKDRAIDETLLHRALKEVKPSTRPWLETARNYAVYANEGGVYDDLLAHLRSVGLA